MKSKETDKTEEGIICLTCKWIGTENELVTDFYEQHESSMAIASICPECGNDVDKEPKESQSEHDGPVLNKGADKALRYLMHEKNTPEFVSEHDELSESYLFIANVMEAYASQAVARREGEIVKALEEMRPDPTIVDHANAYVGSTITKAITLIQKH